MANRKEHVETGAVVGGISSTVINLINQYERIQTGEQKSVDFLELALWGLGGTGIGALFGALPDVLEPATSPHHRKFFHSIGFGGMTTMGLIKLLQDDEVPQEVKNAAMSAYFSYMSHLLLDSKTPKGLPIL